MDLPAPGRPQKSKTDTDTDTDELQFFAAASPGGNSSSGCITP